MNQQNEVRKLVLVMAIGLCDAIRANAISIDEAEGYLFSPRSMRLFGSDSELVEILHMGTELSDIADLLPSSLAVKIQAIRDRCETALRNTPNCKIAQTQWLQKVLELASDSSAGPP